MDLLAAPQPRHTDADDLIEPAIRQVETWIRAAKGYEDRSDRAAMKQLGDLVRDESGVAFVMNYIDQVARPDSSAVAADQLQKLVERGAPAFLSPIDRLLLRAGARVAPLAPAIVMRLAGLRMRSICLLYTSPSPRDKRQSRMPSSA